MNKMGYCNLMHASTCITTLAANIRRVASNFQPMLTNIMTLLCIGTNLRTYWCFTYADIFDFTSETVGCKLNCNSNNVGHGPIVIQEEARFKVCML